MCGLSTWCMLQCTDSSTLPTAGMVMYVTNTHFLIPLHGRASQPTLCLTSTRPCVTTRFMPLPLHGPASQPNSCPYLCMVLRHIARFHLLDQDSVDHRFAEEGCHTVSFFVDDLVDTECHRHSMLTTSPSYRQLQPEKRRLHTDVCATQSFTTFCRSSGAIVEKRQKTTFLYSCGAAWIARRLVLRTEIGVGHESGGVAGKKVTQRVRNNIQVGEQARVRWKIQHRWEKGKPTESKKSVVIIDGMVLVCTLLVPPFPNGAEFTFSVAKKFALFVKIALFILPLSNGVKVIEELNKPPNRMFGCTVLLALKKKWIKLIPKTIGKGKRDCAWGCAQGINTTWENLQTAKHKSGGCSFRSRTDLYFAICRFSQAVFIPRARPHAQSLFLFPIVFGTVILEIFVSD